MTDDRRPDDELFDDEVMDAPDADEAPDAHDLEDAYDVGDAEDASAPDSLSSDPWQGMPGPSTPTGGRPKLHLVPPAAGDAEVEGVEEFELRDPDDTFYCYRHADRETGVTCSNCGRPICYECMTPAAVGFRCPECMKQTRTERSAAPVFTRGQIRDRWQGVGLSGRTPATVALIALNVAMFIVTLMGDLDFRLALIPGFVGLEGEWWRLGTSIFVHASLWHLGFNMFALYIAGTYVESMVGTLRFLLVYFIAGLAGSTLVLVAADPLVATVGASGAVFGLFGGLFAYFLHNRDAMAAAALRNIGFLIAITLVFTFVARGISWQAHIGGLIAGFVVMEIITWAGKRSARGPFSWAQLGALIGLVVLLIGLIVWRTATLTI